MSKLILLLLILISLTTFGQEAAIHFNIKNDTLNVVEILNEDYADARVMFGERAIKTILKKGKVTWRQELSHPTFMRIYYGSDNYVFYLVPGDDIYFSLDANNLAASYSVSGVGSKNNMPSIQEFHREAINLDAYKKDSLPDNVLKEIQKQSILKKTILEKYIASARPTDGFINCHMLYVRYFPLWTFLRFKGSQKFSIRQRYYRNEKYWQAAEEALTAATPLSHDDALSIPPYVYFLPSHVNRIKERFWKQPELLKSYFETENPVKILDDDAENLPTEKIIEKHFTGRAAEFLYASLFKKAINETEDNLPEIFSRFKQKYPSSEYLPYIEPAISQIIEKSKRGLNDNMVLIENPEAFQTFDDVLKLVKGKTVLLDMWGTWCGPCRSELALNSDSIKHHFNKTGLEYLYIANLDTGKEAKWRQLISYYNLTGMHILATSRLTKDIMNRLNGGGYPTYAIIKKDGTFELSAAGFPMDRKILIKQLEEALKK